MASIDLIAINHGNVFDFVSDWRMYDLADLADPTDYDYNGHPNDVMWRVRGFRPTDEFVLAPGGLVAQVYERKSRLSQDDGSSFID